MATTQVLENLTGQEILKKVRNEMRANLLMFAMVGLILLFCGALGYKLFGLIGLFYVLINGVVLIYLLFEKNFIWMKNFRKLMKIIMGPREGKMFKHSLEEANEEGFKEMLIENLQKYEITLS